MEHEYEWMNPELGRSVATLLSSGHRCEVRIVRRANLEYLEMRSTKDGTEKGYRALLPNGCDEIFSRRQVLGVIEAWGQGKELDD
jgi:hypothetical protein